MSIAEKKILLPASIAGLMLAGCFSLVDSQELAANNERIVGGSPSADGTRLYQVSVQRGGFGHVCGGALVHKEWVLTAAHCISLNNVSSPNDLKILAGTHRLSGNDGQVISVSEFLLQPSYDTETHENDIALLHLSSPANADYKPLKLPTVSISDQLTAHGNKLVISGWGYQEFINDGGSPPDTSSDVLLEVEIPVVSNEVCSELWNEQIPSWLVCAGEINKGACYADSGGPLVGNHNGEAYSIGVFSMFYATPGCGSGIPDLYVRTASYLDWINDTIIGDPAGGSGEGFRSLDVDIRRIGNRRYAPCFGCRRGA